VSTSPRYNLGVTGEGEYIEREASPLFNSPYREGWCYLRIRQGCYEGGGWEEISNKVVGGKRYQIRWWVGRENFKVKFLKTGLPCAS
jgi:hypothetical protein